MRKTLLASVLLLALCGSALAGDINSPPLTISNPPSTPQSTGTQIPGGTVETGSPDAPADGIVTDEDAFLTELALRVLDGVLALL